MKEFVAKVGGRYAYKEDWENMRDLAISVTSIFDGCSPFIISGCAISGTDGNKSIASGYVWLDGKIRFFTGKDGIDLSTSNYLIAQDNVISVKYSGGTSKDGIHEYTVVWASEISTGAYITIPQSGNLPTMNDEFFGKYAILSNTTFSKQTISKPLYLSSLLNVSGSIDVGSGVSDSKMNLSRTTSTGKVSKITQSIDTNGMGSISNYYNGVKLGGLIFNAQDASISLRYGDNDQIIITNDGVQISSLSVLGNITNNSISIDGASINLISGTTDTDSLKLNSYGYAGGTSKFRDVEIIDGKGALISRFVGSTKTFIQYGSISQKNSSNVGLSLADTAKQKTNSDYKKIIGWYDKDSNEMSTVGFNSTSNQNFSINSAAIGDIELTPKQYLVVSKPIKEEGVTLANKYANKTDTTNALSTKVNIDGDKVLTDVNFSETLSAKLNGIKTAINVSSSDTGYVPGNVVYAETQKLLKIANNLSDIANPTEARSNLGVYLKSDSDNKYLSKSDNLASLTDKDAARNTLSAAHKDASYAKSEVYKKSDVFTKTEVINTYAPIIVDTGWLNAGNPASLTGFSIKVRRYGNIVNIVGVAPRGQTGNVWFTIPAAIPACEFATGAIVDSQSASAEKNRGMSIYCNAGSKSFYVKQEYHASTTVYINLTYLVD